eukprot:CAMPEP_0197186518 /NCGR_PEP_ID=MMETSP1423-20130617/14108_1 /TAXON_ID=476441 /ORGANISM="Pseudo-nitzschia heimii, Strain UNC1101" /LENGTH=224 /DNA_ID=CAMNT_0042637865 /DNA_START=98 /DNA_END=770 /DNA_ORIENTATION=+
MITITVSPEISSCMVEQTNKSAPGDMRKRRRAVSFSTRLLTRPTLCNKDYTHKELKQSWYTCGELFEMRKYNQALVMQHSMDNNLEEGLGENGEDCFRGLEKKTYRGSQRKSRTRMHARTAVLRCQRKQKKKRNRVDAEKVAEAYRKEAKEALEEARKFGRRDATAAAAILVRAKAFLTKRLAASPMVGSSRYRRSSHPMPDGDLSRRFKSLCVAQTSRLLSVD